MASSVCFLSSPEVQDIYLLEEPRVDNNNPLGPTNQQQSKDNHNKH